MNGDIEIKSEKEKFWQEHMVGWKESGLSQESYCLKQEISHYAFGYWRSRLNRRLKATDHKHFVELSSIGAQNKRSQPVMQIVLPNGVRIGISTDASAQMIRETLEVVSSC